MNATSRRDSRMPYLVATLLLALLTVLLARGQGGTTTLLIAASVIMFGASAASAAHLMGGAAALRFMLIAVAAGWGGEQLGSSYGLLFGHYTYTEVLGPRLGDVPVVIPLMWFALSFGAYVIANLAVWQAPVDDTRGTGWAVALSFVAALVVTAWDLGADPYFVFTLKAWVMEMKDGWWFGETLQGFVGWMTVSFFIVMCFRLTHRHGPIRPTPRATLRDKLVPLVPLALYGGCMVFQMVVGDPVELRTVAFFAIGIPLMIAVCGLARWYATFAPE